ncbi:hypothetical protein EV127DRAFT_407360 [Xylaria flabelliformis]|nr:hypothetical protein EV127DRAFT_407360 [Xylaria flabelliformis]
MILRAGSLAGWLAALLAWAGATGWERSVMGGQRMGGGFIGRDCLRSPGWFSAEPAGPPCPISREHHEERYPLWASYSRPRADCRMQTAEWGPACVPWYRRTERQGRTRKGQRGYNHAGQWKRQGCT